MSTLHKIIEDLISKNIKKEIEEFSEDSYMFTPREKLEPKDIIGSELGATIDIQRSKLPGLDISDTVINNVTNRELECPTCGLAIRTYSMIPQLIQCYKCGNLFAGG